MLNYMFWITLDFPLPVRPVFLNTFGEVESLPGEESKARKDFKANQTA